MAVRQKDAGARAALSMADNQKRAMQFASTWMNQMEGYKTDKSLITGMAYSASRDCTTIGIRPSDY